MDDKPKTKPERTTPPYFVSEWDSRTETTRAAYEQQMRDGMRWRFRGVGDWDTGRLFETLRQLGVDADPERFRDDAAAQGSVAALAQTWTADFETGDLWRLFPYFAALALWTRLAGDIQAPELVGDYLERCARLAASDDEADQALIAPLIAAFIAYLSDVPSDERLSRYAAIDDYCGAYIPTTIESCIPIIANVDPDLAIRTCRVFRECDPEQGLLLIGTLVDGLRDAGRTEDAKAYLTEAIAFTPDSPAPYIAAMRFAWEAGDYQSMGDYAIEAMNRYSDPAEWDMMCQHVADDYTNAGRADEWAQIRQRIHRPSGDDGDGGDLYYAGPERTIPPYPAFDEDGESEEDLYDRLVRDGVNWDFDGLDDWETDRIFQTLSDLGIDAERERFRSDALRHRSVEGLGEEWAAGIDEDDLWSNFPLMAAQELWERLAGDVLAPEIVAMTIEALASFADTDTDPLDKTEIAWRVEEFIDYLNQFPEEERAEWYDTLCVECGLDVHRVIDGALDLVAIEHPGLLVRTYGVCRSALPEEAAKMTPSATLALIATNRLPEAREFAAAAMVDFPESPYPYYASHMLAQHGHDYKAMVDCAVKMLDRVQPLDEWDKIYSALESNFNRLGLTKEWSAVRRLTRRPENTALSLMDDDFEDEYDEVIVETPVRVQRIGRNDPCPCGSGKKYKKCHG